MSTFSSLSPTPELSPVARSSVQLPPISFGLSNSNSTTSLQEATKNVDIQAVKYNKEYYSQSKKPQGGGGKGGGSKSPKRKGGAQQLKSSKRILDESLRRTAGDVTNCITYNDEKLPKVNFTSAVSSRKQSRSTKKILD